MTANLNSFSIPSSWADATIGDLCKISTGKLDANAASTNGKFPFFTCAEDISRIDTPAWDTEAVLLAGNGNFNVKWYQGAFNAYQRTYVLEPEETSYGRFLFFLVKNFLSEISKQERGSTIKYLRLGDITDCKVPLPPLNEQRRIVAKLDALFEKSRSIRQKLDRLTRLLANLQKSILNAAITGKLSQSFRECEESSNWTFERAEDVCQKVQSGGTPKEGFVESAGIPFLKVYNIVAQKINFAYRPQFVLESVHKKDLRKSVALPGDVLMNIVGPPLGKVAIVTDEFPEWNINQAITLFRPSERVTTEWLYLFLCSGTQIQDVIHETKGIVGQVNISLSQCRDFMIPIPPIEEQIYIQKVALELLRGLDVLAKRVTDLQARISTFEAAALCRAFRGELVPQDPSDEPASVLLERIRAKKPLPGTKRGRGRKATA